MWACLQLLILYRRAVLMRSRSLEKTTLDLFNGEHLDALKHQNLAALNGFIETLGLSVVGEVQSAAATDENTKCRDSSSSRRSTVSGSSRRNTNGRDSRWKFENRRDK